MRAAQSFAAIAERLGDVDAGDACLAVEIGKRAGDAKCPVIAACAQAERVGGLAQKRAPGLVGRGDILEQAPVAMGIGARAGMFQRGEALGLNGAGRSDTGAHLGTSFRRRRQHEVGGRDRRHFDLQIDAVEQRPLDARLIALDATAPLSAGIARLAGAAAAAWIHRGDELNARRVGDPVIGARDHRLAGLERLA